MTKKSSTDGVIVAAACFRQRVTLPAAQAAGLSDAELATALAFEIEPFSGMPQAGSEIAWRRREDGDGARCVFDVVQMRASDLAAAVARARAEGRRVRAVTAAPDEARGERLEDMPCLPVRARSALASHPYLLWSAACLLAAGVLAAEWVGDRARTEELRRDVAVRRELQAEKDRLESRTSAVRRETEDVRRRRADAARAQARAAGFRAAGRVLLEAVREACREESVVRGIRAAEDGFELHLSGIALSPEAASRTLVRLTEALSAPKSGWTVRPGAVGVREPGGTCTFDCAFVYDGEEASR